MPDPPFETFFELMWPQWPLPERVPYLSEKLDFLWSIPQKGTGIGHFGARDDQIIRISNFFDEMRLLRSLRPLRLLRLLRSLRLQKFWSLANHYWGLQSHPGILIQPYFYVMKKRARIMKCHIRLKIWDWESTFGRVVKAISSLGVHSPWFGQYMAKVFFFQNH